MEEKFWQARWREKKISFHENQPNGLLEAHFHALDLPPGSDVFVPLSGKAVDLDWLGERGMHVVGIEFNEDAVREVFDRRGLIAHVDKVGDLTLYSAGSLRIFVGDFFDLTSAALGPVDAIYDRAALVALPRSIRERYVRQLANLAGNAPQLVVSYDYDQSQMDGPPFSVPKLEVERLYQEHYDCELLSSRPVDGQMATRCAGEEIALLLSQR